MAVLCYDGGWTSRCLEESPAEFARRKIRILVRGVSQAAGFRSSRWARVEVCFASGRAWRSEFRDLRHPKRENAISGVSVREQKSIIFVARRELRACDIVEVVGVSAELRTRQTVNAETIYFCETAIPLDDF